MLLSPVSRHASAARFECPFTCAAYHEPMAEIPRSSFTRPLRWSLWLGAGVVCGLTLGFLLGLAKPRIRR